MATEVVQKKGLRMSYFEDCFKNEGSVRLRRPELLPRTDRAMLHWQKFCQLRNDVKDSFTYSDQGNTDGAGYERKTEQGRTLDLKENFHFTVGDLSRIIGIADQINDYQEHKTAVSFVDASLSLMCSIEETVFDVAGAISDVFKLPRLAYEVIDGRNHWILRFLHYFPEQEVGSTIAKPHPDKSGVTFYLGETTSGVQYLTKDKKWEDMLLEPYHVVITPSLQLQYRTGGKVKALYHQVVANQQAALYGRYSMVLFIPFMRTLQYDKMRHGRTQDFPLGWNYDMPDEEFAKLFV